MYIVLHIVVSSINTKLEHFSLCSSSCRRAVGLESCQRMRCVAQIDQTAIPRDARAPIGVASAEMHIRRITLTIIHTLAHQRPDYTDEVHLLLTTPMQIRITNNVTFERKQSHVTSRLDPYIESGARSS